MKSIMKAAIVASAMVAAVPASAQIINLSATNSGSSTSAPLALGAGSYTVSLVDRGAQSGGFTAWAPKGNFTNGAYDPAGQWVGYYSYSTDGGANFQFFNPLGSPVKTYDTATEAFNNYSAAGPQTLTLTTASSVVFAILDARNSSGDNTGGLSLNVVPSAVPEPATWAMMLMGVFTIGGALRSTRRKGQVSAVTA